MTHRADARPPIKASQALAQRIDKWLWCARLAKTRSLATKLANAGGIRLTRGLETNRINKASALVRPGDRIAFMTGARIRVVEIAATADRRGPADEAALLYRDHSPPQLAGKTAIVRAGAREAGAGRPTKKDRRDTDRFKSTKSE